jgi:vacuolar-type H+-ATPase subunit H
MSIEDIKQLIQQEKNHEQKVQNAKAEADRIIKTAEEEAKKIISKEAENLAYYEKIKASQAKEAEERKEKLLQEYERKTAELTHIADANMEKAVDFIVRYVLKE